MKTHEPAGIELAPEERSLIDAIDASFRPAPADALRAARFAQAVERRIERHRRMRRIALPAGAVAAAALAALLWSVFSTTPARDDLDPTLLQAFADPQLDASDWSAADDYLPDDYRALASLMEADEQQR